MSESPDEEISRQLDENSQKLDKLTLFHETIIKNEHFPNDFDYNRYAFSPHGGAIAVAPKPQGSYYNPNITLYSSNLRFIVEIKSEIRDSLVNFYLTPEELLIAVHKDSTVCMYNQKGKLVEKHQIFNDKNKFVEFVSFWETGFFIVTTDNDVYCVENFVDIFYQGNIGVNLQRGIARPAHVDENGLQYSPMLIGTAPDREGGSLIVVVQKNTDGGNSSETVSVSTQPCPYDGINEFHFSPSYNIIVFRSNKRIFLFWSDLSSNEDWKFIDFPDIEIDSIQWLGDAFILLIGKKFIYVVGQIDSSAYYEFNDGFVVSSEVDGARIITPNSVEYISLIPEEDLKFFDAKTKSIGQQLFSSICNKELNSTTDVYEKLQGKLEEAITELLKCSQHFRSKAFCSALLEVVSKAMFKVEGFSSTDFSETISNLRTCLYLAEEPSFMPLSVQQFNALGQSRLLIRLCNRYQHFLAFRIADYWNVSPDNIYSHFAYCLISSNLSAQTIVKKLQQVGSNVDSVELASLAFDIGKKEVGDTLLHHALPSRTIPIHIKRGQLKEAVTDAVNSQDTALLVYVLEQVKKEGNLNLDDILKNNRNALYAWLSLETDDAKKIETLLKYELKQDALMIQFDTKKFDAIKNDWAVNSYLKHKEFLKKIGKDDQWKNLPPLQVFSLLLESNNLQSAKDAEKAYGFNPTEILWGKVQVYAKNGNEALAQDFMTKPKEDDIHQIFSYLNDLAKFNLMSTLINSVKDEQIKNSLREEFKL